VTRKGRDVQNGKREKFKLLEPLQIMALTHAIDDYVTSAVTSRKRCFLCGPFRDVIRRTSLEFS
jgi:hypothetical protein